MIYNVKNAVDPNLDFMNVDDLIVRGSLAYKEKAMSRVMAEMREVGAKHDDGKLLMSLVQPSFIKGVAEVLTFGAKKYTAHSWQTIPNAKERYIDALLRHLYAYLDGEQLDNESGLHHLKHVATNIMFIQAFENKDSK